MKVQMGNTSLRFDQLGKWYNLVYKIKPPQFVEHFRTTILKVSSNGEIVREIKRI